MDIFKKIIKEEHKKHSLLKDWHKEELIYFIQDLINKEILKKETLKQSKIGYSEEEVLQLLLRLKQTESYDNLYEWFNNLKK